MKNISIIIPVHEFDETVDTLLRNALKSVSACREEFKDGHLPVIIVATHDIKEQITKTDINTFITDTKIIWNDGKTDFCSQINFAVDKIDTDYYSIKE